MAAGVGHVFVGSLSTSVLMVSCLLNVRDGRFGLAGQKRLSWHQCHEFNLIYITRNYFSHFCWRRGFEPKMVRKLGSCASAA